MPKIAKGAHLSSTLGVLKAAKQFTQSMGIKRNSTTRRITTAFSAAHAIDALAIEELQAASTKLPALCQEYLDAVSVQSTIQRQRIREGIALAFIQGKLDIENLKLGIENKIPPPAELLSVPGKALS